MNREEMLALRRIEYKDCKLCADEETCENRSVRSCKEIRKAHGFTIEHESEGE